MNIHEYQAKDLFAKYGIEVPKGFATNRLKSVPGIVKKLGGKAVVKAQIHAGGRGKGGGVKVAKNLQEAEKFSKQILGMTLITHQTGPEGKLVKKLLLEEPVDIRKENYVALLIDRETSEPVFIVSTKGGMDIEEVARKTPDKIVREFIDPSIGFQSFQARKLAFALGLKGQAFKMAVKSFHGMYRLLMEKDCSQVEVNPFVVTGDDRALAADAKVNFDDNALYRHPDIVELRDLAEEEPAEVEASEYNLNFIKLDGNVGCMVNGAGLAMATMDAIKLAGGDPANFLDVGGGANPTTVENAFRIIMQDKSVKGILINVFGGIVRCDRVANGVYAAVEKMKIDIPVVVRLSGTNAEEGKKILDSSTLQFITATSLSEAAKKVIQAIK